MIPGNHDYYGATLDDDDLVRITTAAGADLAQRRVLTFGNCRLLCWTLWMDFALLGDQEAPMARARIGMLDYTRTRRVEGGLSALRILSKFTVITSIG